jgi:hypothetical protein
MLFCFNPIHLISFLNFSLPIFLPFLFNVDKVFEYDILGKTYAIKEDLKANGFSWNGSNWTLMSAKEIDLSFLSGNKKIEIVKREF